MAKRGEADPADELAKLVVLQIRLQLGNQANTIVELDKAGIGPGRIAALLNTTPGTVNVTLQRARKRLTARGAKEPTDA